MYSIQYNIFSGVADFIPVMEQVTFLPEGKFPECVYIPIVDDEIALEPAEQFRVILSLTETLPGLLIGSISSAVVSIIDNDGIKHVKH